uniref:Uncharacterized protein n=1 Tax=Steinernema glaseri TaxID=37863 RepID=A0A1I8A1Q6_9BILA
MPINRLVNCHKPQRHVDVKQRSVNGALGTGSHVDFWHSKTINTRCKDEYKTQRRRLISTLSTDLPTMNSTFYVLLIMLLLAVAVDQISAQWYYGSYYPYYSGYYGSYYPSYSYGWGGYAGYSYPYYGAYALYGKK